MKYFLDLGTHFFEQDNPLNVGKSPAGLLNSFYGNNYMSEGEWVVKTYEPSKMIFEENLKVIDSIKNNFFKLEAFNEAVLNKNGKVKFKTLLGNPAGSNCIEEEVYMCDYADESRRNEIDEQEVTCVDIFDILHDIIYEDENAEIHIKCDIEGSEFKVLPRLLEYEFIEKYLKAVYVEWHERFWEKSKNYANICNSKNNILEKFALKNIPVLPYF